MNDQIKILSAACVFPMRITIELPNREGLGLPPTSVNLVVNVDYVNDKVYFESDNGQYGHPLEGVNYDDLQEAILAFIRPKPIDAPQLPSDLMDRVKKVQAGEYQSFGNLRGTS